MISSVDFRQPTRFTHEHQRALQRGNDMFCRAAANRLTALTSIAAEMRPLEPVQLSYGQALPALGDPDVMALVDVSNGSRLALTFSAGLLLAVAERLLGGTDAVSVTAEDEHALTDIELRVSEQAIGMIVAALSATWSENLGLTLSLGAVSTTPQLVQLVAPSEPTMALPYRLSYGGLESDVCVIVPHTAVSTALEAASTRRGAAIQQPGQTTRPVGPAVAEVPIVTRAEVSGIEMTIGELQALQPGDVVALAAAAHRPVTLWADDRPVHAARVAVRGSRRVAQVLQRLHHPEPDHGRRPRFRAEAGHDLTRQRPRSAPSNVSVEHLAAATVPVWAELGRALLPARELLALQPGEIVVLDRAAEDHALLYAAGHLIAAGTMVTEHGQWAMRIEELR